MHLLAKKKRVKLRKYCKYEIKIGVAVQKKMISKKLLLEIGNYSYSLCYT